MTDYTLDIVERSITVEVGGARGAVGPMPALASQAEAEAGADNVKYMSSLRTNQAIVVAVAALIAAAPGALNTLDELAAALGDDANFAATVTTSLGNRVRVDTAQGFTAPQMAQARSNIGLGSMALEVATDYLSKAGNLSGLADLAVSRTNLGLGTAALATIGTSGATVPLLSTANTWALQQTFSVSPLIANASGKIEIGTTTTVGIQRSSGALQFFTGSSTAQGQFNSGSFELRNIGSLGWGSGDVGSALDLTLFRDAANILAQRNGTNAQINRIYNTWTDASNYERGGIGWGVNAANYLSLFTQQAGTGSARNIWINAASNIYFTGGGGGSGQWQITTAGHFVTGADSTYDIGASGANRPRDVYIAGITNFGSHLTIAAAAQISWAGSTGIKSTVNGVLLLRNNAGTDFDRIQLGGSTAGFPALKRSATTLQARLADDSAFAPLQGNLRTHANAVPETPVPTHTIIITDAAGQAYRVACCV